MSEFPAPPKVHVLHVPGADKARDVIVAKLRQEANACVHEDPDRRGLMPTWLESLQCARENDSLMAWSVILSDDAYPIKGWQQHIERACAHAPQPALGLTHFGGYGERGIAKGVPYSEGPYLLWGGAVAFRRVFSDGLFEWASKVYADTGYPHDDVLACAYALKRGAQTCMVNRAIFDQPVGKSLLGHNTPIRRPSLTIEDPGVSYRMNPRSVWLRRSISPKDELERLAALA